MWIFLSIESAPPILIIWVRHEIKKQTCLCCFCPSVLFARPLLDEPFVSEPKRATLDSSISFQPQEASHTRKPPLDPAADLFPQQSAGQGDRISLSVQEEPNKRKREEEEENIEMDELESIMSVDMDFDDEFPAGQSQEAQPLMQSSHEKTRGVDADGASSASKRQRLYIEGDGTDRRPQHDVKENQNGTPERHKGPLKTDESPPLGGSSTRQASSKRPQSSSSSTHTNTKEFEDIEVRRHFHLESNPIVSVHIISYFLCTHLGFRASHSRRLAA